MLNRTEPPFIAAPNPEQDACPNCLCLGCWAHDGEQCTCGPWWPSTEGL